MNYMFVKFSFKCRFRRFVLLLVPQWQYKTVPGLYVKFMVYSVLSVYIMFCLWQREC